MPLRVAVVGATGYTGSTCAAILQRHPEVDLVQVVARRDAGRALQAVVPTSPVRLVLQERLDPGGCDAVVSALPHGVAAAQARAWLDAGAVLLDCSADFRLRDPEAYRTWYGVEHPDPPLLAEAVYGLPELRDPALRTARLVALPGCFPTAAILAAAPALRAELVEPAALVDAKSAVSGAGRSLSLGTHFPEVDGGLHAYAVGGHRHLPEMEQELTRAAGTAVATTFVPHLVPAVRGLLATVYLRLRQGVDAGRAAETYRQAYRDEPFVTWTERPPSTKWASGTNRCFVHTEVQGPWLVALGAIDNLWKGAASQAVQALNLRFGLAATAGLDQTALWP
ncbi:MAG TPA: N-acetyl-gamma-glutamyl-phosphate reductase [Candidatus Micrarchaeia archaeon]|nr:N-acetyl-gamma-glutamyl-phosphate reductase [Candidatus Micrarchaeia archaeon]